MKCMHSSMFRMDRVDQMLWNSIVKQWLAAGSTQLIAINLFIHCHLFYAREHLLTLCRPVHLDNISDNQTYCLIKWWFMIRFSVLRYVSETYFLQDAKLGIPNQCCWKCPKRMPNMSESHYFSYKWTMICTLIWYQSRTVVNPALLILWVFSKNVLIWLTTSSYLYHGIKECAHEKNGRLKLPHWYKRTQCQSGQVSGKMFQWNNKKFN